ncbi:uncharacterized acetyltransferase-like protein [Tanacetum coccineum]
MESASLKMISDCFIKPKFVSEEAKKPTYMAPWDLAMLNLTYIQKGLLYSLPPEKKKDFSTTNFVHRLKDSLSDTLTHFHPLAGRLATVKQTNPPSVVIFINPENSPGARFIHASLLFHLNSNAMATLKAKVELRMQLPQDIHFTFPLDREMAVRDPGQAVFPAEKETSIAKLAVNVRSRMTPPLPEHTSIREYVDSWVKKPIVHKMDVMYDGVGVSMSSSPKSDMYGVEFGLGKGVAVLCGNAMKFDAKVSLNAGRPRDGEGLMDVDLSLLPETMALFETDQEFMSLVQL